MDAQLEVARRHIDVELEVAAGRSVAMLLWDLAKFFDACDSKMVCSSALEFGFPPQLLGVCQQAREICPHPRQQK